MGNSKNGNEAEPNKEMPTVYILMTKYKDGDPEIAGVFSSFDKAVAYFVRTDPNNTGLSGARLKSACVKMALKMAHKTEDEDWADFGDRRAWIDEYEVDDRFEDWENEDGNDSK